MSVRTRIATSSLGTLEAVQPPFNLATGVPAENLQRGLAIVETAGRGRADIVCLPETFVLAGVPGAQRADYAETLDGETTSRLADLARRFGMYVVAGLLCKRGSELRNVAVLIDREGQIAATYSKIHLTPSEIHSGLTPGDEVIVVETDLGRVGFAVCFDINWPALWAELGSRQADIVFWPSAYNGGFPLRVYSWCNRYTVVSSVLSFKSRVIDPLANVLAKTSRWKRVAMCDVDLHAGLFHVDEQAEKIAQVARLYGGRVEIVTSSDHDEFAIRVLDETLDAQSVAAEVGLERLNDYIIRCDTLRRNAIAAEAAAPKT